MSSEALHFKYRPKRFEDVAGNSENIAMVKQILERPFESIPRTWLFTGESGTGKTTMVRIIKDVLGCHDADFHEFNSANTRGIDTIREISQMARLSPMSGTVKAYLLDEFHMVTKQGMEAALKMLEDVPKNTFFFLATTNPEKVLKAIKTRSTTIKMKTLQLKDIVDHLTRITKEEGIEDYPKKVLTAIAKASQGSCREAVKILDQIIDIEDDDLAIKAIDSALGEEGDVAELCKALLSNSPWRTIADILKRMDMEPESVRLVILNWFSKVLLDKGDVRIAEMIDMFKGNYYDSGKAGLIADCFAASQLK